MASHVINDIPCAAYLTSLAIIGGAKSWSDVKKTVKGGFFPVIRVKLYPSLYPGGHVKVDCCSHVRRLCGLAPRFLLYSLRDFFRLRSVPTFASFITG